MAPFDQSETEGEPDAVARDSTPNNQAPQDDQNDLLDLANNPVGGDLSDVGGAGDPAGGTPSGSIGRGIGDSGLAGSEVAGGVAGDDYSGSGGGIDLGTAGGVLGSTTSTGDLGGGTTGHRDLTADQLQDPRGVRDDEGDTPLRPAEADEPST